MRAAAVLTGLLSVVVLVGAAGAAGIAAGSKTAKLEAIRLADAYAACVVKRRHDVAAMAILSNSANGEIMQRYPLLNDSNCFVQANNGRGGSLTFSSDTFRYVLANRLVRADFADFELKDLHDVLPLRHLMITEPEPSSVDPKTLNRSERAKQAAQAEAYRQDAAVSYLSSYGECVVRADPAGAKRALMTEVATPGEDASLRALMPSLSDCMLAGRALTFSTLMLRGTLAINYYRLAHAPRQSQSSGNKI